MIFDAIFLLFSACSLFGCIMLKGKVNSELLAFSVAILVDTLSYFSYTFRLKNDLNLFMTSISNCLRYTQIKSEDELYKISDSKYTDESWPSRGQIEYKGVTMRYKEELDNSLEKITFTIKP